MMPHRLRRASALAALLVGVFPFHASSAAAVPLEQPNSSESHTARSAFRRLMRLAETAESRRGGGLSLARRQAETSGARTTAAWLDWLPNFSIAVRRQIEQGTGTNSDAPRWRLDFEGQLTLSLQKLHAAGAARAAEVKAQAELEQARHSVRVGALSAGIEFYLDERKVALLETQVRALEALRSGQASGGASTSDGVVLEGYLGELRGSLAELQAQKHDSAQRLAASLDVSLETTGIDPRLGLPALLESIRAELADASTHVAEVRRADTRLEEERLRWIESQTWYVPEFRSTTLALMPRGNANGTPSSSFRLTSITTELALGLRLRPGVPALSAAQRQALAKSHFDDEQSRLIREQTEDQARARLEALSRAWQEEGGIRVASTELDDTVRRFARGERSVAELAAASRSLLAAQLNRELILKDAVLAQVELSSNDATDLSPKPEARREELAASEVDLRARRSLDRAPSLKSAHAEAERATQRARSERFRLASAVDAGVLLPVYETDDPNLVARPELSFSGSGSLATIVREASVVGRWSLDLRATGNTQRALESEARLRRLQAELARKKQQWSELSARMELAHARKRLELAQQTLQFAREARIRELRWLEQGAASERDVQSSELAYHTASVEQNKLEARLRSAELRMASYLGAARGTQISVDETPDSLERWGHERFLPDNHLFGFESVGRRREAELETEYAHAQTEALANPPQGTTLTTQATQGLRGGAFSFTVALSVALDSPRDALQVTRAAEHEGAARGRLASLERELDEQRARERQRLDQASALLEAEAAIQQRLSAIGDALRLRQAASPDMHAALKQRQLDQLRAAFLESERRRLEADEQRRAAAFRELALGDQPPARRKPALDAAALAGAVHTLTEQRADVTAADAAAEEARAHQPIPVVSALHLVGPFGVGSYAANRVVGPATTKVWRGDLGVGLALGLDESIAFLGARQLSTAADLERGATRRDAALQAVHEIGRTWTARQLERASAQEEAEARRHLEGSVEPRFGLGQVATATLMEAQQQRAMANLQHSSDESLLRTQHTLLAAMGANVSDATLDEYQRVASAWLSSHPEVSTSAAGSVADSAELAARARSAAASSATTASALRLVSPITALVEFRPSQLATTTGTDADREKTTSHELLWVLSLIVPFKPKELGSLAIAAARARESDEELGAASREARLRRLGLSQHLAALQKARASATARRATSERALEELDRRLRAAQDHATIDEVATARRTLSDARRAEILLDGAVLETALLLRAIQEKQ